MRPNFQLFEIQLGVEQEVQRSSSSDSCLPESSNSEPDGMDVVLRQDSARMPKCLPLPGHWHLPPYSAHSFKTFSARKRIYNPTTISRRFAECTMAYYMKSRAQKFCYRQIKNTGSLENDVDNFWLNLLPDYFQKKLDYIIAVEARPLPGITKQRADWTIRSVKNGDPTKVILMEDKRKEKETSSYEWQKALTQLTDYMTLVRAESDQNENQTLYGAVNIGTYTRFYQLEKDDVLCVDYPGTTGEALELMKDEEKIHHILLELVHKTSH